MKKPVFAAFAVSLLAVLLSCGSSAPAVRAAAGGPAFTGDGGSGIRVAVLVPDAVGLPEYEEYLPALVQGVLVDNFSRFSAITVLDRLSLESVLMETESGIYQTAADFGQLGDIIGVHYVLTGSITRTTTGHNLQVSVVGTGRENMGIPRATFVGTTTVAEMDDHTGIRRASMQLLGDMGVALTDNARHELSRADSRQSINAQTALAQGIAAQRAGNTFETMLRFNEAAAFNPALAEAVSRAATISSQVRTATLGTGSLGQDVREDIAWRNEWLSLREEALWVLRARPSLEARVVYDPSQLQGTLNHARRTMDFTLPVFLVGVRFPAVHSQAISDLNQGLAATGRQEAWGIAPISLNEVRPRFTRDIYVTGSLGSGGRWFDSEADIRLASREARRSGSRFDPEQAQLIGQVESGFYGTHVSAGAGEIVLNFSVPADYLGDELEIRLSPSPGRRVEAMSLAEFEHVFAAEGGLPPMRMITLRNSSRAVGNNPSDMTGAFQAEIASPGGRQFGLAFRHECDNGNVLLLPNVQSVDTTNYRFPVSVAFLSSGGGILRVVNMRPGQTVAARPGEVHALVAPRGRFFWLGISRLDNNVNALNYFRQASRRWVPLSNAIL